MDLDRARRLLEARKRRIAENARKQAERLEAERGRAQAETQETVAQERAAAEEKARRETNRARIESLCAVLRAFYYPKQASFFQSKAERRATKKTRRSGATAGGCRELIARAISIPRFRAVYITETRIQAEARAWKNDTNSGLVDVIEMYGRALEGPKPGKRAAGVPRYDLGSVTVEVRGGDLALVFSNGSLIELFGADDEQACMGLRGLAKHVYWVDEAQDFRWLQRMYKAVISAGMSDHGGECWLTGTPGVDLAGLFYEVTRDDGDQVKGWEVHHLTVQDNPFFGRVVWELGEWFVEDNLFSKPGSDQSTHAWNGWIDRVSAEHRERLDGREPEGALASEEHRWGPFRDEQAATEAAIKVRWERGAGKSIRENAWDEDDPDLLREWYARWVKDGARLVYAAHSRTEHELCYAPMRLGPDGFPDIKLSLLDLPGWREQRQYLLGVGADLGTTRAFGWVMVAWSLVDPVLYEVASWKKAGLDYDEMAVILRSVQAQARVGLWVADAGGGGKPAVKGWSRQWMERYQIPILEAQKPNKLLAQKQLNTDIRQGHWRGRHGSPLVAEWKVHRWLPTRNSEGKLMEDPATHRDLCFIAGTMIGTEFGQRAIEQMRPGDRVWTRAGLRSVTASWCSGIRPIWRLDSGDGSLVGTADHPVWTDGGWKPLSELTPHDTLTVWASMDHQKSGPSEVDDTAGTQNPPSWPRRVISSMAQVGRFIARSGSPSTDRSRRAITSITSTETNRTTAFETSSASKPGSISASTCERPSGWRNPGRPSRSPRSLRRLGTGPPKAGRGTPITRARSWRAALCMITFAWSAVVDSARRLLLPACAACDATHDADATAGSTTPTGSARNAASPTVATSTLAPNTARSPVRCVHQTGIVAPVYNLTVEGDHEYFAEGVLVSNCDASLYIHRESYHHRYRPAPEKLVTGTPEWVTREETEMFDAAQETYGR